MSHLMQKSDKNHATYGAAKLILKFIIAYCKVVKNLLGMFLVQGHRFKVLYPALLSMFLRFEKYLLPCHILKNPMT